MTGFAEITLLRPQWLLILPVIGVFGWWLMARRGGLGDWHKAADPGLMQAMAALGRVDPHTGRMAIAAILAAVTIAVLALSGPAVERRDTLSFRNLDGVLFVVDTSSSVTGDDRWSAMLTMGRFGLAALGTRTGGLIVYGGDAYVATDMTRDHLQLGQTFSLIDPKIVPDAGSRPLRALTLAADLLAEAEVIAGDVVLFTDGAGLGADTLPVAERIAQQGARLSLVSLHAPDAAFATHAATGGGEVFTLDQTDELGRWLSEDARTRLERDAYPLLFWHDFGRYLLLLGLVPVLLMFRREAA